MVNELSVSAATQHCKAPISAYNIYPNNQSRYCCQAYFLKQNLVSQGSGFAGGNGSDGRQSTHGTFVFTDTAANTFL